MAQIDQLGKGYYCPLKVNRRVDDSGRHLPYQRIDELDWNVEELQQGKLIKIRDFPKVWRLGDYAACETAIFNREVGSPRYTVCQLAVEVVTCVNLLPKLSVERGRILVILLRKLRRKPH